jgi:MFS transporter, NNP family, nitrate/nitrite transporter
MLPLALILAAFVLMAKDSPKAGANPPLSNHLKALGHSDMWWFCLLYSVTFGGYVGLSSFLPLFLRDQYALDPVTAGSITALAAFVGSGIRPVGGYLADRVGGVRLLSIVLVGIAATYACVSMLPPIQVVSTLLVAGMACFGVGNGSVFQLVPQRFSAQIGIATGMVGAIGGLGGFFLPILLGSVKESSGSFAAGFVVLAVLATATVLALRGLVALEHGWRVGWRRVPSLSMERV